MIYVVNFPYFCRWWYISSTDFIFLHNYCLHGCLYISFNWDPFLIISSSCRVLVTVLYCILYILFCASSLMRAWTQVVIYCIAKLFLSLTPSVPLLNLIIGFCLACDSRLMLLVQYLGDEFWPITISPCDIDFGSLSSSRKKWLH